jgi:chemotaxis signal transduction protein
MSDSMNTAPSIASSTNSGWLSPTDALNRYVSPERLAVAGAGLRREQVQFGFRVGDLALLIPAKTVTEVVRATNLAAIPKSAPWLQGIYNLRGNLVPVIDIAVRYGLARGARHASTGEERTPHILIFGRGDRAAGISIDGFPRGLTGLRPVDYPSDQQRLNDLTITASYTTGDDIWFEFDPEALFKNLANVARQ